MTPQQFERAVAAHFQRQGYRTEVTALTNDHGVDVFATKGSERLAVQCKMYGGTSRRVNRSAVLELYGAAACFDCTGSVIATNGQMVPDAQAVADKLGVQILFTGAAFLATGAATNPAPVGRDFPSIWARYVMPLAGRRLDRPDGTSNVLVSVDWSGVWRTTSNGRSQFIKIEIFEWAVNRILHRGWVERDEINQEYVGRASSGIVLILSQVPLFQLVGTGRLALGPRA